MIKTILQVSDFENLTSNYYLSTLSNGNYYSSTTLSRLPSIIANVEINLNAMLNGRLYKRYPPGNVQYHGYNGLSPAVEKQTLLQALTECVEYKLITQQYVNLNNSYSGAINGSNNYQTQNNNVIGLRQDITAKLTLLGLYASILLGDKKPDSVLKANSCSGSGTIVDYGNYSEWVNLIQNTSWQFSNTCYFNGGINTNTLTTQTINATTTNTTTLNATQINGDQLNISNFSFQDISTTLNGITYKLPQSMLNFCAPWEPSLSDWSFFSTSVSGTMPNSTTVNILGGYYLPNAKMSNQNATATTPVVAIKCHWQSVTSCAITTLSNQSWFDTSTNEIDVNAMLTALYPNGIGTAFTITGQQLQDAGISLSTFKNIGNPQLVVDKIDAKINQIQTNTDGLAQDTIILINPIFQEPCQIGTLASYYVGALTCTIVFISPKYQVASLGCNPETYSQVNIGMDVYFTIVIPV